MPQAISFDGTGSAELPGYQFMPTYGGVEFYVKSTTRNQILFSTISFDYTVYNIISCILSIVVFIDAQGNVCVADSGATILQKTPATTTTTTFTSNTVLTDGNFHQISIIKQYVNGNDIWTVYIDGVAATASAPVDTQTTINKWEWPLAALINHSYGNVSFGSNIATYSFLAPPAATQFNGLMTEIRAWYSGQQPTFMTSPRFSLNYGVPVDFKNTPLLHLYWPLWSTNSTPLTDMVSNTALTLKGGATVVNNAPPIYEDLSDILSNTTQVPFDLFLDPTKASAFSYIMTSIGKASYTPAMFRGLYANASERENLQVVYTQVKITVFPQSTTTFSAADFSYVQDTLTSEISAATNVWGYYDTAAASLPIVEGQIKTAASDVWTNALVATATRPYNQDGQTTEDIGTAIDLMAAGVSLVPGGGEIVGAGLKALWAVISWATSGSDSAPTFNVMNLPIQATAGTLNTVYNEIAGDMQTRLLGSVNNLLTNFGYLSAIYNRINNGGTFRFNENMDFKNNPALQNNLTNIYNGAIIYMTRVLVTAGCNLYREYSNIYGYNTMHNLVLDGSVFGVDDRDRTQGDPFPPQLLYCGGAYIIGTSTGTDEEATYTGVPMGVQNFVNISATALGLPNLTVSEVFTGWGVNIVDIPTPPSVYPPSPYMSIEDVAKGDIPTLSLNPVLGQRRTTAASDQVNVTVPARKIDNEKVGEVVVGVTEVNEILM